MKVIFYSNVEAKDFDLLLSSVASSIEIKLISQENTSELIANASECQAIIGARIPREFLDKAKNLKYFIIPFTGIPPQDLTNLIDSPNLTVINSHFNAKYVAEHAFAMLLASAKRLIPIHLKMKCGDWTPRYEHQFSIELRDKNLLIVGFGAIGREIAKFAKVFGMKVSAIKRNQVDAESEFFVGTRQDLVKLLPDADFIVLCLPGTSETKDFLNENEFEFMKQGVHIINVGRGSAINEQALFHHLKADKIAGVALDTWWNYPRDKESRTNTFPANVALQEFDNVIFSPHRASHIEGREIERMKDLADILNSIFQGNPKNIVNISNGY